MICNFHSQISITSLKIDNITHSRKNFIYITNLQVLSLTHSSISSNYIKIHFLQSFGED